MKKDHVKMAFLNLRKRRLRSWLTMIGIFIGISAVVALVGLGEGLNSAVSAQFNAVGSDVLRVAPSGGFGPPGTGSTKLLTRKNLDDIKRLPTIKDGAGRIIDYGRMEYNDKFGIAFIGSVPYGEERKMLVDAMNYKVTAGRLLKDSDTYVAVIGSSVAEGENFDKKIIIGSKIKVEGVDFEVIGILKKTGSFTSDSVIMINEDVQRELFDLKKDEYDALIARVHNLKDLKLAKESVEKLLRKDRDVKVGEEDFSVETTESIAKTVNSTLFAVQLFVYIIAAISVVVGGIGIMNTMYTSVLERTQEIGVMKAIGARNSDIFTIFFFESGFMGLVGGVIGILLGVALAKGLAFIGSVALGSDLIRATISLNLVLGALAGSFILGIIFGTLPAYQASKLRPVEALQYSK